MPVMGNVISMTELGKAMMESYIKQLSVLMDKG